MWESWNLFKRLGVGSRIRARSTRLSSGLSVPRSSQKQPLLVRIRVVLRLNLHMRKFVLLVLLLSSTSSLFAQTKNLLNLDKNGLAVQGYYPATFFTKNKPVNG